MNTTLEAPVSSDVAMAHPAPVITTDALANAPRLPVNLIIPGNNPRKDFSEQSMQELTDSVKAFGGIYQPILVRPLKDDSGRYEIIAGERRFRATVRAFGNDDSVTIPALITECDDEHAARISLGENIDREKMSPLDEAEAAARIVGFCNGSREKAAASMGWEMPKLQKRLALMYAIEPVRIALRSKAIELGHAELLAGLRKESQEQGLAALTTAPASRPTVEQFKSMLERMALSLDVAIFDKTDCAGCPHNAGTQQALFSVAINGANCTNKACYDQKTEAEVQARAKALKDDFQVVRIIRPGDNYSIVALQAEGPKGVGQEQANACRTCTNFGAAVSAMPDSLGNSYKNQCMDTKCHVRMVAKRIKEQSEQASGATAAPATASAAAKAAPNATSKAPAKEPAPAAKPAPTNAGNSRAVVEYREKVWRAILQRTTIKADPETAQCILLSLLLSRPSVIDHCEASKDLKEQGIDLKGMNPAEILSKCLDASKQVLSTALTVCGARTATTLSITDVVKMLKVLDVKMEAHWAINAEFLDLLTKNEIDALCQEMGINKVIGDSYAKTLAGKKDAFIAAIMKTDATVPFKGRIPKMMRW